MPVRHKGGSCVLLQILLPSSQQSFSQCFQFLSMLRACTGRLLTYQMSSIIFICTFSIADLNDKRKYLSISVLLVTEPPAQLNLSGMHISIALLTTSPPSQNIQSNACNHRRTIVLITFAMVCEYRWPRGKYLGRF